MLNKERLLHPGTIIAVIALMVALSGAGYAATKIGTAQLKNNAVATAKIKNGAVTTAKLKNGAVTTAKLANNAVTTAKIANGAVTAAKLGNDAVTAAKIAAGAVGTSALANGSVTNEKLANGAVTGAKIAGATITATNIAPGQVVTGRGSFVSAHQVLATGAVNAPVLTLPGVGQLRASCAAGVTTISFLNQSGTAVEVTAWGVNDATALTQQSAALANGLSTTGIVAAGTNVLGLTYQVGFVAAGNVQQATTAEISAGPSGTSCAVTASGLTTG
jgi:trimeric autotransporter adhesin